MIDIVLIPLMEEILHHLGCTKPCKYWEKIPTSTGDTRIFWTIKNHQQYGIYHHLTPITQRLFQGSSHLHLQYLTFVVQRHGAVPWHSDHRGLTAVHWASALGFHRCQAKETPWKDAVSIQSYGEIPSWKRTYPFPHHSWRWFSFSKGGIC